MSRYEPCPVDGCGGDARYAPPGRGHSCTWHDWITARTTPDETPRATLAEDERAVAEVLAAHEVVVRGSDVRGGEPVVPLTLGCTCGADFGLAAERESYDVYHAHVAEQIAPLLAAARAAGVAQGLRDAATALWDEYHDAGLVESPAEHLGEWLNDRAARIAEGAEQREDGTP